MKISEWYFVKIRMATVEKTHDYSYESDNQLKGRLHNMNTDAH